MLNQEVIYNSCSFTLLVTEVLILVVAARVAEKKYHNVLGQEVEVQVVFAAPTTKSVVPQVTTTDCDTILVKGLTDCHTESALKFFFTNKKKCGGGEVTKIVVKKDNAYITFADPKGTIFIYSLFVIISCMLCVEL